MRFFGKDVTAKLAILLVGIVVGSATAGTTVYATANINSSDIQDNTIVSADLRDNEAVRSQDIRNGEVKHDDLSSDSVRSSKIRDGEVKTEDIADEGVTSTDILDGTIQAQDIAAGVIPTTPSTPQLVITQRTNVVTNVAPNTLLLTGAECNSDEIVVGGGFSGFSTATGIDQVNLIKSHRNEADNSWKITIQYVSGQAPRDITAFAECAKIVP